jgi:molecular chaperone GrpE (heat shock protein)
MEGSLAEAQAEVARLNDELLRKSENFEQERKSFDTRLEAEFEKNFAGIPKRALECLLKLWQSLRAMAKSGLQLSGSQL